MVLLPSCKQVSAGPPQPQTARADESDIADFVGSEACGECHADTLRQHQATYHAHTLRTMSRAALGDLTPPAGPIPVSNNALLEDSGQMFYQVDIPNQPEKVQRWPLDFAFGAGKHGLTPVHMLEGRNVVEMKRSYFPHDRIWRVTPGKSIRNPAIGVDIHNLAESRACLGCHSVAMSKNTFVPRPEFWSVGCESCHGAGRPHIQAIRAGASDIKMARLKQSTPEEIDTLCGRCHYLEKDVINSPVRHQMTYRFHSFAVMTSRCYLESGKQLSCLNCHSPHDNAKTDSAAYTPACLACHRQSASEPMGGKKGAACPVSPSKDCVRCHMPKRDYTSVTHEVSGIMMTDHRIAIHRESKVSSVP